MDLSDCVELAKRYASQFTETGRHNYDLMHLTLTVPHTEAGFRGEKFYFKQLSKAFHDLRTESNFWDYWVFGGEYGLEATGGTWISREAADKQGIEYDATRRTSRGKELARRRHTDGLHIHIHALLFVRREKQSRNQLHRLILLQWNKLTRSADARRREFTPEQLAAIKKGNKRLTDEDVAKLDPTGATLIGLETIFSIDKRTGEKVRGGSDWNSKEMRGAVMETISYHFEPMAFNKDNKEIDLELLCKLVPKTKGLRMYGKFGCLMCEKSLNISPEAKLGDMLEEYREAVEVLVDEDTGEILPEATYFICNPALVYHKMHLRKDETGKEQREWELILSNKAKNYRMMLMANSTLDAIKEMNSYVKSLYTNTN